MPIEVRTHPLAETVERETNINIPTGEDHAHVYSEQPGIMRRLLRNPVAIITKLTVWEGDVVAIWAELPKGAIGISSTPRKSQRVSKVHSTTGLKPSDEMFRGGLDAVVDEHGDAEGRQVGVPPEVQKGRLEAPHEDCDCAACDPEVPT